MSETGRTFDGVYHDGQRAGSEPVRVTIDESGLAIDSTSGTRLALWPFNKLIRHPDDAEGRLRFGCEDYRVRQTNTIGKAADFRFGQCPTSPGGTVDEEG